MRIVWSAPVGGIPDDYLLYFKDVREPGFQLLGSLTDTICVIDPGGATGVYKVLARYGRETFDSGERLSTEPVYSDTVSLGELNTASTAGYGWWRGPGTGAAFDMRERLSEDEVDFYVTDFRSGSAGPDYYLASPHLAPADPGGGVPLASWRVSGFTPPLVYEDRPLPSAGSGIYADRQALGRVPAVYGCYTEDGHYALIKVVYWNVVSGQVKVKTWFQPVRGLRLVKH